MKVVHLTDPVISVGRTKTSLTIFQIVAPSTALLYIAYKNKNKTRGGLDRVCATETMYRFIGHLEYPKFQTGIFVKWKTPLAVNVKRWDLWNWPVITCVKLNHDSYHKREEFWRRCSLDNIEISKLVWWLLVIGLSGLQFTPSSDFVDHSYSTVRIGRHVVLLPINHNHNTICVNWSLLKIQTQDLLRARAWWRSLSNYLGMTRTVVSQRTIDAELKTGDLIANQIREGCLTQNPTRELRMTKEGSATIIMWPWPPSPSPPPLPPLRPFSPLKHYGTVLRDELGPSVRREFAIANERSDWQRRGNRPMVYFNAIPTQCCL